MTTLFERLDAGLAGNDVSVRLSAQAGNLSAITNTVTGLATNPPQSLADLGRSLAELRLPDIGVSSDFTAALGSIQGAIPGDLSSVTGGLTAGLTKLQEDVMADLVDVLQQVLITVQAIYRLTQLDLECAPPAAPGAPLPGVSMSFAPAGGPPRKAGDLPQALREPAALAVPGTVDAASAALDSLPSPLTVDSFLTWLAEMTAMPGRANMISASLPVFDDLHDPLETLVHWKSLTPVAMRDELASTLQAAEAFLRAGMDAALGGLATDLEAAAGQVQAGDLAQIADGLKSSLGTVRAAIEAGDLGTTGPAVAQINTLLDQYQALSLAHAATFEALPALSRRLDDLPDDLADQMDRVVLVLRPADPSELLNRITPEGEAPGPAGASESALKALEDWLHSITGWVEDLLDKLDLSAILAPLQAVADKARQAVDALDDALVTVTLQVQALFGQVDSLLQQVNIQAVADEIKAAIAGFKTQLVEQLTSLFAPVREAVSQVVAQIGQAVDSFNPADIVNALKDAIQALASILDDPEVKGALEEIQSAVQQVTDQLQALSFAPLADDVIAAIGEIKDSLDAIDTSQLSPAVSLALQAALAILPESIKPLTDPLIAQFGELVQGGPAPLVASVKEQPQRLLEQVKHFEPAALLGDTLSQPYNALLAQMDGFKPSSLLQPVQAELDTLKGRLAASANPGQIIQPLEGPFNTMLQAFDQLKPDEVIKPLQDAVQGVISGILDALPIEDALAQLDPVLSAFQRLSDAATGAVTLLQRIHDMLGGFGDAPAALRDWVEAILAKVEQIADMGPFALQLTSLSGAIDESKAAALAARFDGAADPVLATLGTLDPHGRLTALIQAYRRVSRQALAALPDSPAKTAVLAALDRFDPMKPAFNAPYQAVAGWQQALARAKESLTATLAGWDATYHAAGGALATVQGLTPTPANLHTWLRDALEFQFIRPVSLLFEKIAPAQAMLGVFHAQLQELTTKLQTKLTGLLSGPDSLGGIQDAVQSIVKRLQDLNFGFLRDQLADLFTQVRAKLAAVDPAQIRQAVEAAFDELLAALDLSQLLPAADVAKLDEDYGKVIDKLKLLDPGALVVEVVQPVFEETVPPLLEPFDLTPLLTAVVDRLNGLAEELNGELDRIDQAYQELRGSMPSLSLGVSLDIGF